MVQPPDVPAAFTKYGHPTLSDSDMTALWNKAYPEHVATVSNYYNNATAANGFGVQLNQLRAAAQTVIIDMGYMHPNLPTWPNSWQQITTGNWDGPGQTSQRKQDLANILQNAINARQLPANAGSTKCNQENTTMISTNNFKKALAIGLVSLVMSASAQTSTPAQSPSAASSSLDWTTDGTRDKLTSAAQLLFGSEEGFYIAIPREENNRNLIASQFQFAFGGRPEPEVALPSGRHLFAGADPESISEKALVVTDADRSTVRAIAMFHASCGAVKRFDKKEKKWTTCPPRPVLTFFVRDGEKLDDNIRKEIANWIKGIAKQNNAEVSKLTVKTDSMFIRSFGIEVKKISHKFF